MLTCHLFICKKIKVDITSKKMTKLSEKSIFQQLLQLSDNGVNLSDI